MNEYLRVSGVDFNTAEGKAKASEAQSAWEGLLTNYESLNVDTAKTMLDIVNASPLPQLDQQAIRNKINALVKIGCLVPVLAARGGSYESQDFKSSHRYMNEKDWTAIKGGTLEVAVETMVKKLLVLKCLHPNAKSFTHMAAVIQLARKLVITPNENAAEIYHIGRSLRQKLGDRRGRHNTDLIPDFPWDPEDLASAHPDIYAALIAEGLSSTCSWKLLEALFDWCQ